MFLAATSSYNQPSGTPIQVSRLETPIAFRLSHSRADVCFFLSHFLLRRYEKREPCRLTVVPPALTGLSYIHLRYYVIPSAYLSYLTISPDIRLTFISPFIHLNIYFIIRPYSIIKSSKSHFRWRTSHLELHMTSLSSHM